MVQYHMMAKRNQSDIVYSALNPNGNPFNYIAKDNKELEIIGLVLWVTEGDKTQVSLANGNPQVIQKYLEFLRKVCRLKENKIKAVIHCHDTLPYNQCLNYWSKVTKIPVPRFTKPYIKKDRGGRRKYPFGILRIAATNRNLVRIFNDRLRDLNLSRD